MLIILSGVSGAGKDTIKKQLLQRMDGLTTLPSLTSRKPREGEIPGDAYVYITKEEFEEKIQNNELYEYNYHHENYYGTSKTILNGKIEEGKVILKDIEVVGTENLVNLLGNDVRIVTIFLKVDKQELKSRLIQRGDNLSDEEIELRLGRLEYEESKIKNYDYVIKNNDLEKTVQIIMSIIQNEKRMIG